METDVVFFARRALEERLVATTATHELARKSHLEMARRYEELASAIIERERSLGVHLGRSSSSLAGDSFRQACAEAIVNNEAHLGMQTPAAATHFAARRSDERNRA